MKYFIPILLVFIFGCATGFQEHTGRRGGYKVVPLKDSTYFTHISTFSGNAYTNNEKARIYSKMAAINFCAEQRKIPFMGGINNLTKTFRDTEVNSINGEAFSSTVNRTYPKYSVYFRCDNELYYVTAIPQYSEVKPELLKDYVSDFKGGIQIESFTHTDAKTNLKKNDVLIEFNDTRITNQSDLAMALLKVSGKKTVPSKVIRDRKFKKLELNLSNYITDYKAIILAHLGEYCLNVKKIDQKNVRSCMEEEAARINLKEI